MINYLLPPLYIEIKRIKRKMVGEELKYLLLLMLIPIILISLVIYIDRIPVITGLVTAQHEEINKIGTYSIIPSFKAKIDYNLEGEYKTIKPKDLYNFKLYFITWKVSLN